MRFAIAQLFNLFSSKMQICQNNTVNVSDHFGTFYTMYTYVLNVLCNGFVGSGLIGNVVILIVLLGNRCLSIKPLLRYIIGLVVFDLFALFGTWLSKSWKVFNFSSTHGSYVYATYAGFVISSMAITACIWCTVLITAQQYVLVCHPQFYQRINKKSAKQIYALLIVAVLTCVYRIPKWFELRIVKCVDKSGHEVLPVLQSTWLLQNLQYMIGYRLVGGLVFHSLGPFVLIVIMSLMIIRKISTVTGFRSRFRQQSLLTVEANEDSAGESALPRSRVNGSILGLMTSEERRMIVIQFATAVQFLFCYRRNLQTNTTHTTILNEFAILKYLKINSS